MKPTSDPIDNLLHYVIFLPQVNIIKANIIFLERKYPISASSHNNGRAIQLFKYSSAWVQHPRIFCTSSELMDNQSRTKIKNMLIKCWFHVITRSWFLALFPRARRDIRLRPLNILPLDERETSQFFQQYFGFCSLNAEVVYLCKS